MDIKKKISIAVSILFLVLVTVVVGTYAYFNTGVNSGPKFEAGLQSGDMNLVFADNDNGINAKLMFGESVTKKFTIRNAGTLNTSLSLEWEDLINTYLNGSLSYRLEYSETEDGEYQTIVDTSNIPVSSVETTQTLASELAVPAGETYYYNLIITLNDLAEIDQSPDRDATFTTRFVANQPIRYRRYKLTVDPNGGVWEEYVNAQEYLMMYDDVKEIEDPTRSGYVFAGWENSSSSSKLEGTEFTMGIGDTTLKAIWAQESYTLTIDANGGIYSGATTVEVPFRQTTTIATPTREGYTFAGWEVSAGKLEDDTFTMNCMEDAKLTAKWVVNNYKYIVYHNQMNTSGNGYTLVSADTDEGEAAFGSTISPDTKVYQGFTAPNKQSLTIRVDNSNPPTLNKVDYNYARNKYNLTINPNGGSYNNSTTSVTEEVYYGAEKELLTPTKEGYNFANWSVTGAKLDGTTLTMSDAEATVTANYTPKTFNITFNANGGSVSTQSKVVTYDSTYEELPTPTYEGYRFLGWFTEASGGTEVVSSTQVSLTSNQTLFAHWKRDINDPIGVLTHLNIDPKEGTPNFVSAATTDEGVYAMEDDYGMSYYYRGAVTNNYVKFAGFYWRIIRINGDGSLRIIYDGTQGYANGVSNTGRFAYTNKAFNAQYNDNKYVGWMFGGAQGTASTSKTQAQTNTTNSDIKTLVDSWYKTNIVDKNLGDKVADVVFCNDRTTPGKAATGWSSDTGLGYGSNNTAYGATARVGGPWQTTVTQPNFTCPQKNDAFTVSDEVKGNGNLTYPVGLITADEVLAAGSGKYGTGNSSYYLYKGSWYWSLSPYNFDGTSSSVFDVNGAGQLRNAGVSNTGGAVAPVINLKAEYVNTLRGTGTISDPYTV